MKTILQILLIILVVSTTVICTVKPDMHKSVLVYDSIYTVSAETEVEVKKEEIPIMEKSVKAEQKTQKVEKVVQKPAVKTETREVKKTAVKSPKTETKAQTKTVQTPKIKTETVKIESPKTEKPVVNTVVKTETPKVLTQQEETIAWNIWRSNLQNQIMQDVKLPIIPNGIVFRFTFTVDKFGKISNLQTWSDTPTYTPYAIQYIAPVIRSYQGRSILNFPQGTARNITDVKGGWRISESARYSSPNDYNDIEKVIK